MHDEPLELETKDRPLHLMSFSVDWVGRPGMPLTEQAKLESMATKVHRGHFTDCVFLN